jgi:alpha-galactosidase
MDATLENAWLQFILDPGKTIWNLSGRQAGQPGLLGAQMGLSYRRKSKPFTLLGGQTLSGPAVTDLAISSQSAAPHGPLEQVHLALAPDANGVKLGITFSLPRRLPLLLWRFTVENGGEQPIQLDRLTLLQLGEFSGRRRLAYPSAIEPLKSPAFFSNGWQSWSYAGTYAAGDRFRSTRLGFLRSPTDINAGTPQPKRGGHFASDFFGVLGDRRSRCGLLAGFLSQRQHFGSLEVNLNPGRTHLRLWANGDGARLDPGRALESDWACLGYLEVDDPDPLGDYVEAVAREHGLLPPLAETPDQDPPLSPDRAAWDGAPIPTGWCSWYQYSTEDYTGALTAGDVRQNLSALQALQPGLPLQSFQIDDGFQANVGDWFSFAPAFSEGVAPLADEIASSGFTPGLWLAPFIVHPSSQVARAHPDWLLRGRLGRPVNAGYLWNNFATALDLTHPQALEYAERTVHTAVHQWGYRYLKLDFLYAAALPGRAFDPTLTRAQILRRGLEAVRAAAGEGTFLLGCGCPLGPAIGLVEAMRIGADTTRRWLPSYPGIENFIQEERNLPSARNALHNALTRSAFHRRWWINDPDCLLLNSGKHLNLAEVRTFASVIALTGGSLFLSDDLAALPASLLRLAGALLPPIGRRPQVLDWFDTDEPCLLRLDLENSTGAWHLLAQINWEATPQEPDFSPGAFGLDPQGRYHGRDFWSGQEYRFEGGRQPLPAVPPHGIRLLSVRPLGSGEPLYLGSDLHISQGLEVRGWESSPHGLALRLERPGPAEGVIVLSLPAAPRQALVDGRPVKWEAGEGLFRFPVSFEGQAEILVEW